jgi:hypothetical protein
MNRDELLKIADAFKVAYEAARDAGLIGDSYLRILASAVNTAHNRAATGGQQ